MSDYFEVYNYLSNNFIQVNGDDFYKSIFPNNENEGEFNIDYSKPNAIYLYQDIDTGKMRRRIMLNDTWKDDYMNYIERNPMTLCSGLSYRGRTNKLEHAQHMNALIFDIDGVGIDEIKKFFERCDFYGGEYHKISLPRPTYTVLSGTGIHLYYVFTEPIDLFPNVKLQLKDFKYDLTRRLWHYGSTSKNKSIQYQSINQGFRMVGSTNSKYGLEVVAFETGEKVDIDYLNEFVFDEKNRVDIQKRFNTKYSLKQAKEQFPDWYDRVIVKRQKNKGKWVVKEDVYKWWLNKITNCVGGHRYYTMLSTVIYADKCGIDKNRLKKDLEVVFNRLKTVEHTNELTREDFKAALEIYGTGCHTTPLKYIERITAIRIDKNKRNYRKQSLHLRMARSNLDILREEHGKALQGRKPKKDIVKDWQNKNPFGKKIDCERETGLSRHTVLKWWDS